jgi:hypothetical protein
LSVSRAEDRALSSPNRNWVEVIGVAGVVASLVFVGLEIRQNTAAVKGATYQAISDSSLQHARWFADNEMLLNFTVRIYEGAMLDDFKPEENLVIFASYVMTIRRIENIYVQVREGLVEEEAILRFRPAAGYFDSPYFREFWKGWRSNVEPEFLKYFESAFLQ